MPLKYFLIFEDCLRFDSIRFLGTFDEGLSQLVLHKEKELSLDIYQVISDSILGCSLFLFLRHLL